MTNLIRLSFALLSLAAFQTPAAAADRPNILWITCEDMGPHIGPYGDTNATTPHLDRFAENALRYKTCWSNAPVCAPARTTLITGRYATTLGAEHMRSEIRLPDDIRLFPQDLRDAGYYCTNNAKEDYNVIKPGQVWDESSKQAHWKHRKPGQPFFAVFNIDVTHEGQIQKRRPLTHDPAQIRVPPYQPDLLAIREDWAQYFDNISRMDALFGERLTEIEDAGLAEETIVWFFSDHGAGLPRNKRCAQNSGLHVPFIVHIPEKFQSLRPADYVPGGQTERMVSFVDFGPTVLSLVGVKPPAHMQGVPFLGPHAAAEGRRFLFGYRGRMDERLDLVRCLRDDRYVYVRNFLPDKPQGQHVAYMFLQAGTRAWKAAFDAGGLDEQQAAFFQPKPAEALYDLEADPDEVQNLAGLPEHVQRLSDFRRELRLAMQDDLGLIPEAELHRRASLTASGTVSAAFTGEQLRAVFAAADAASRLDLEPETPEAESAADDSALIYWQTRGLIFRGESAVRDNESSLVQRLEHSSPSVRIVAAEALVRHGRPENAAKALDELAKLASAKEYGLYVAVEALNTIDSLGDAARPVAGRLSPELPDAVPQKLRSYVPRLVESIRSGK